MTPVAQQDNHPSRPLRRMRPPRAFTLIELLIAVGLFAAFGLVAAYAFTGTMRLSHQTTTAHDTLARNQRLLDTLRRDVWSAGAITIASEQHVTLTDGQGATVTWRWTDGALTRQAGDAPPQRWTGATRSVSFAVEGPALIVTLADDTGHATAFRLVSQLRLGREDVK